MFCNFNGSLQLQNKTKSIKWRDEVQSHLETLQNFPFTWGHLRGGTPNQSSTPDVRLTKLSGDGIDVGPVFMSSVLNEWSNFVAVASSVVHVYVVYTWDWNNFSSPRE